MRSTNESVGQNTSFTSKSQLRWRLKFNHLFRLGHLYSLTKILWKSKRSERRITTISRVIFSTKMAANFRWRKATLLNVRSTKTADPIYQGRQTSVRQMCLCFIFNFLPHFCNFLFCPFHGIRYLLSLSKQLKLINYSSGQFWNGMKRVHVPRSGGPWKIENLRTE